MYILINQCQQEQIIIARADNHDVKYPEAEHLFEVSGLKSKILVNFPTYQMIKLSLQILAFLKYKLFEVFSVMKDFLNKFNLRIRLENLLLHKDYLTISL